MRARKSPAWTAMLTVAAVAVAAAACGSSAKTGTAVTTPTTASNSATPTTAGPGSDRGSSASDFCGLVRNDVAAFNPFADLATMTPTNLKALYSKLGPALAQAKTVAPDAIKGDFATFATFFQQLESALAGAQYDVANLDPTSLADLYTANVRTASADISRYVTQVCHIARPTTPTT